VSAVAEPLLRSQADRLTSLIERIERGITSFNGNPPASEYQQGYLAALQELYLDEMEARYARHA
jgi:hypothetical protein